MPLAIRCTELKKTYPGKPPVEAVRGIDLAIDEGECFGVLGPNGAGKTTTIEMLEGLLAPTAGEVEVLGIRWRDDPQAIRQRIGISLQETRFSDKLTVLRNGARCFAASTARASSRRRPSPASRWKRRPTPGSRTSPAGRSSGWPWPWPWSAIRRCCFSTSRPPGSIRTRAARCGRSSPSAAARAARPC